MSDASCWNLDKIIEHTAELSLPLQNCTGLKTKVSVNSNDHFYTLINQQLTVRDGKITIILESGVALQYITNLSANCIRKNAGHRLVNIFKFRCWLVNELMSNVGQGLVNVVKCRALIGQFHFK